MTTGLRPVVISGPSGVGKSTLLKKLFSEYPDKFGLSVSHTTRKQRPGEEEGEHYHFTNVDEMRKEIGEGKFIEYAEFSGNMYGTSKQAVANVLNDQRICILDVDKQGVENIKKTDIDPLYIFVKPPSIEVLEARLRSRGTETDESLLRRMGTVQTALTYSEEPGVYDLIIINEDLEKAYSMLREYLLEKHTSAPPHNSTNNNVSTTWTDVSLETPLASIKDLATGDNSLLQQPKMVASVAEIPLSPTKSNAGAAVFPVETKEHPSLLSTNQLNPAVMIDMQEEPTKEDVNTFCGRNACSIL